MTVPAKVTKLVVEWQPPHGGGGVADREGGCLHPGRRHTVVAAGAVVGDALVGEERAGPGERRMAGIALEIRDDVRRSLALRHHTVVAGLAAAARLGVVEVDRRVPGDGRMAAGAPVGREDVVGGLGRGADGGADAVTGTAVGRGALENGGGVTGLAGQVAVLADELEAGGEVVEIGAGLCGKAVRNQPQREQQRRERVCTAAMALSPDRVIRYGCPDTHTAP